MNTKLLPHNDKAYAKVFGALKDSQRTCVIHPTGTGKSYLMAAVSEEYKKVLILGPNVYVLNQVHKVLKWRKKGIKYMTYAALMHSDTKPTGYDLICLDEFHRVGAPEWGSAVEELLEVNPQAKIFGTTATNIRYLDEDRDMAQEIFDGNVASRISIAEAWSDGILPIPRYVSGLFRWDKTVDDAKERISNSRRIDSEEKRKRLFRLSNACLHWNLSYGMPAILRKHLDKDTRRVIIFCSYIEMLEQMRRQTEVWFREAGFNVTGSYFMHSNMTEREQREQMSLFEADSNGVKLMFSINMLNEGIHIPDVGAVIMLRTTSSRIIYLQQMGRCLTTANTANPLVLDMVDNITTTTVVDKIATEFDKIEAEKAETEHRKPRTFEVIDYTLGVKDLISKLVPEDWVPVPFEERLARVTAFCEKYGRVPGRRDTKEESRNWYALLESYGDSKEVKEIISKYCDRTTKGEKIEWLVQYVKKNGQLPRRTKQSNKEERTAYRIYANLRDTKPCDPCVQELIDEYSTVKSDERLVREFIEFVEKNDRLPIRSKSNVRTYEYNLADKVYVRLKNHPKIEEIRGRYGYIRKDYVNKDRRLEQLKGFIRNEGRLPGKNDREAYKNYKNLLSIHKRDYMAELEELINKYQRRKDDKTIVSEAQQVIDFIESTHHLPRYYVGGKERQLSNYMSNLIKIYSDNPRVEEMKKLKTKYSRK